MYYVLNWQYISGSLIPKLDKDYARPGAGHRSQGNTSLPILVVGSGQVETDPKSN